MRMAAALTVLLGGCVTIVDPFEDVAAAQRRLDERGMAFDVSRVPGREGFALQVRAPGEPGSAQPTNPLMAARAAAPEGCSVETMMPTGYGGYRIDYDCDN